ncbi:SSI family serine proteinase inhibitor [Streptomyces termitum]|uniref:SSI family serine proteinase inhibitor n=1 Tax=Streptomyces termitum TaxID=67368 RepID=UPI00378DF161
MKTRTLTALAAALLLAAPALPAAADTGGAALPDVIAAVLPAPAGPVLPAPIGPAATRLTLTVAAPGPRTTVLPADGPAPAAPAGRTVSLRCDPPAGDHPRAADACADLDASGGRIDRESTAACVLLYDPVEVRAEGVWRGRPVSFSRTYGNGCELAARTGAVFAF